MKYLITGISGTLGQAVSQRVLAGFENRLIGFSRDECKQAALPKNERMTLYLGDIRDRDRLLEASRGVDLIFHFAALKHVDILETNPEEAIATNIEGTENVLHAQRVHRIPRVVLSATDKGAYPVNVYGMTKGIAERLTLRNPNNIVCRYGNVAASRGSAIPSFIKTLKEENTVYLTDPKMTRFWITINEASQFVFSQAGQEKGGLKIPKMKATSIQHVASAVAELLSIRSYETVCTGMRAGEKLHECLQTDEEGGAVFSNHADQYTKEELLELLRPIVKGFITT